MVEITEDRIKYAKKMGWNAPKYCWVHSKMASANYECEKNGENPKYPHTI
jgi:hypothetical protein